MTEGTTGEISLEGREARCPHCMKTVPSDPELFLFEYRGEGSKFATESCGNCGYNLIAHTQEPDSGRGNVVKDGRCSGFVPRGPHEFDTHYCGCRGWD